jgi:D-3-phosphoglycerate dehydrogenase/(S)-sulfolactate dehydrogenase
MARFLIMYTTAPPTDGHLRHLADLGDDIGVATAEDMAMAQAPEAEVILGHRYLWQVLPRAVRLRWVQSSGGGIDHLIVPALLERDPLLTRTPIFNDVIAWHALSLGLALVRGLGATCFARGAGLPPTASVPSPLPRVAMIFGMGGIGHELGWLLKGLGCTVLGVNRSGTADNSACDAVLPKTWREHLGQVDLLFLCAPLMRSTWRIINSGVLDLLPPHAALVNVARGGLVDNRALADRLETGRLAGAALDVLDHVSDDVRTRLERLPSAILTPHNATFLPSRQERFERFVEEQVRRYLTGQKPLYAVDYQNPDFRLPRDGDPPGT